MSDNQIDVTYIAKLAKLELSDEEIARFSQDLNQILAHVEQLNEWDVEGIAPMSHPLPDMDALRADNCSSGLSNDEAMANAPACAEGQIRVPKVVESAHS